MLCHDDVTCVVVSACRIPLVLVTTVLASTGPTLARVSVSPYIPIWISISILIICIM
jgi:hypothetical protein